MGMRSGLLSSTCRNARRLHRVNYGATPVSDLERVRHLHHRRGYGVKAQAPDKSDSPVRNIGIIAHIDAGKTTTTERMLYYAGYTRRIGDVDDGSTVTDFLPAERARGITIQSAAITLHWPPLPTEKKPSGDEHSRTHTINLIDTPGHADFTFEVVRSLRILDGAICILDAVAGVEAQTERVWEQASSFHIPRIVYINKLDRSGAAFARCVREVATRLGATPALCQIPWWEGGKGAFVGVGDAINLCGLQWMSEDGRSVKKSSLAELEADAPYLAEQLIKAREALVNVLCSVDEKLLEIWMECEDDAMKIKPADIVLSLRRCLQTNAESIVPILAGASFKNIAVQPLLDAINALLPGPHEAADAEVQVAEESLKLRELLAVSASPTSGKGAQLQQHVAIQKSLIDNLQACALAFKVVNDAQRGILVYIRVYSGTIRQGASLWNTSLKVTERATKLLRMYASDAVDITEIPAGHIGVLVNSKHARTGDTLIDYKNLNVKHGPPAPIDTLQLRPIAVPPPVFFAAIAPNSLSDKKDVEDKLALLLREDPSLQLQYMEDTGQTLLSGMGELHLEIARDRLVKDFKAKATMGPIEISYRETLLNETDTHHYQFVREMPTRTSKAGCAARVEPLTPDLEDTRTTTRQDGNAVTLLLNGASDLDSLHETALAMNMSKTAVRRTLTNGALAALARGPKRGFPLRDVHVIIDFDPAKDYFGPESSPPTISSAVRGAVEKAMRAALQNKDVAILEPVMNVVISCDESSLGNVVHDISSARGGQVLSLEDEKGAVAGAGSANLTDVYTPPDPFGSSDLSKNGPGLPREVVARVPLKEMVGYLKHLRSMTAGRGSFVMTVDKYERVTGLREKALL